MVKFGVNDRGISLYPLWTPPTVSRTTVPTNPHLDLIQPTNLTQPCNVIHGCGYYHVTTKYIRTTKAWLSKKITEITQVKNPSISHATCLPLRIKMITKCHVFKYYYISIYSPVAVNLCFCHLCGNGCFMHIWWIGYDALGIYFLFDAVWNRIPYPTTVAMRVFVCL